VAFRDSVCLAGRDDGLDRLGDLVDREPEAQGDDRRGLREAHVSQTALRDSLEYRRFRPYGTIVATVEKLDRAGLLELLHELDRFERTSPRDPFALLDRCAAMTRLQAPEQTKVCDEAEAQAPPAVAGLIGKARALQAAP